VTTPIRLRQLLRNWGDAPLPCLLTRQAPSTNAAREGKHVLPNSFYGNVGTKFPKTAERRLSLGSSSPARTAIRKKQPRSLDSLHSNGMRGKATPCDTKSGVPPGNFFYQSAFAVLTGKAFRNCSESETQPSNTSVFKRDASWFVLGNSWPIGSLMQSLSKTQR
jgi:hypothetical protein